jgi:hypothetical protein
MEYHRIFECITLIINGTPETLNFFSGLYTNDLKLIHLFLQPFSHEVLMRQPALGPMELAEQACTGMYEHGQPSFRFLFASY